MFNMKNFSYVLLILLGIIFFSCDTEKSKNNKSSENIEKIKMSGKFTLTGSSIIAIGESQIYSVDFAEIKQQEVLKSKFSLTIKDAPKGVKISDLNLEKKTFKINTSGDTPVTAEKQWTLILSVSTEDEKYQGSLETKLKIAFLKQGTFIAGNLSVSGSDYISIGKELKYLIDDSSLKPTGLFATLKAEGKKFNLAFKETPPKDMTIEALDLDTKKFKIKTKDSTPATASTTYTIIATAEGLQSSIEISIAIEVATKTTITSSVVAAGAKIADKYGADGNPDRNYFPPLNFNGKPINGSVSRCLIFQDNNMKTFGHGIWIIDPKITSIPEIAPGASGRLPSLAGKDGIKEVIQTYFPPSPPRTHTYGFHLFDTKLSEADLKTQLDKITSANLGAKDNDRVAKLRSLLGDNALHETNFSYDYGSWD